MRLASLFALGLALALPARAQSPSNDRFDQAIPVVPGQTTYTGSNVGASAEADASNPTASCQPADGGNSVYWSFRPAVDGQVAFDFRGSSFDTVATLLDGFSFDEVGCDDDGLPGDGDVTSILIADVLRDYVYVVRVTGFSGASGDIVMDVVPADPAMLGQPASDPSDAYILPLTAEGVYTESNVGASSDLGEATPSCQANDGGNSIWRTFVAAADGVATFDLSGSSFDTVLTAHPMSFSGPGAEIGCDDDSGVGLQSLLSFPVQSGLEYAVRVGGYNGQEGQIEMAYSLAPPVATEATPTGGAGLTVAPSVVSEAAQVELDLPAAEAVTVELFSVTGRRVAVLHDGDAAAGRLALRLDASALPAGAYVVRAVGETVRLTERLTVVR